MTRSRLDRTLLAVCVVYAADLIASITAAVTGFAGVDKVSGPAMVGFGVTAVVFAVRAARHPGLDQGTRRGWRVVAGAFALALATPVLFLLVTGARPFPQPGDGTHLAFAFLLAVALQLFPVHQANRRERWKTLLDAITVAAGASMLVWYVVIGPALAKTQASAGVVVAAAAYPVVDLVALFGFARVLLRGTDRRTRRPLWILAVGFLAQYAGDAYLGYMQAHSSAVERTPWQFVCWLSMHFLLAVGAIEQCRQAEAPAAEEEPRGIAGKLPYAGIGLGYGLMAFAAIREPHRYPWLGLVLGGMVITGVVVLRQSLAQRESDEAAATDPLTGLPNRGRLNLVLARALDRAARSEQRSAVLLIDLNGFKQINDTLGHQAGDGLLTAVAVAMRGCVRGGGDLIGRLGGDEFAVVLPVIGGDQDAVGVAQRITDALAEPVIVGDQPLQVSASIGVATCEPGEATPDALLHRADVAMYAAKRGNHRRAELWTPALRDEGSLEADLGRAVTAGRLSVCYEPSVDRITGEIAGVEAMARWQHPVRGEIGPDVFLPIAERTGAIDEIGRWVLEEAATQAARWHRSGRTPYLIVFLSPRQLDRPDFVPAVRAILDRAGLDPRRLVLQLTGTAPALPGRLRALRELGIRIGEDHRLARPLTADGIADLVAAGHGALRDG